jgi:site-specific DNA-methyltransferase (adenine-specific)
MKITCIDCIEGLSQVRPKSIDVVVTSPPYNLGIKYECDYADRMPRNQYLDWMCDVGHAIEHALSDKGSFFLNMGSKPSDPTVPFEVLNVMLRMFKLQNTIHWIKSISVEDESYGHFKPINSPRFINDCHEYIFHLTKNGDVPLDRLAIGVPYKDKTNIKRWSGKTDIRCQGNTWFLPYETIQEGRGHPATFPVELPERCFKLHGLDRLHKACDPFVGIGSSAIAAQKLGIPHFIGMDLSETYVTKTLEALNVA